MKKLLIAVLFAMAFCGVANAAVTTATFGDYNSSGEYRVKADSDGVVTFASDSQLVLPATVSTPASGTVSIGASNTVSVGASSVVSLAETSSIVYPYRVSTVTLDTVAATDSGKVLTAALTTGTKFILPSATPGLRFTFIAPNALYMTVDTVSTFDTIRYLTLDGGDSLKSTGNTGDSVQLICNTANKWDIMNMFRTWTDNGTD